MTKPSNKPLIVPSRRDAMAAVALGSGLATWPAKSHAEAPQSAPDHLGSSASGKGVHDFAFQTGHWQVRHRTLKRRLAGDSAWREFTGTCAAWEFLAGAANGEDQVLDHPDGAYRAAALRRVDPATGIWSIWWWDSRLEDIGPPVRGRFEDGVGTFFGDDELAGRPIKVRYIWSGITPRSAHWEQAFSADGGASWETNWTMAFARAS